MRLWWTHLHICFVGSKTRRNKFWCILSWYNSTDCQSICRWFCKQFHGSIQSTKNLQNIWRFNINRSSFEQSWWKDCIQIPFKANHFSYVDRTCCWNIFGHIHLLQSSTVERKLQSWNQLLEYGSICLGKWELCEYWKNLFIYVAQHVCQSNPHEWFDQVSLMKTRNNFILFQFWIFCSKRKHILNPSERLKSAHSNVYMNTVIPQLAKLYGRIVDVMDDVNCCYSLQVFYDFLNSRTFLCWKLS